MPLLGALFVTLFGGLASWLAQWLTRKVAVIAAGVAMLSVIIGGLYAAVSVVITPLAQKLFTTSYGSVMSMAFPPVSGDCIAAVGLTWVACAIYRWQRAALSIAVQA